MGRSELRKLREQAAHAVEKGKWKQAGELYDRLSAAQPEDTGALHRAGEAYRKLGRRDLAIARFVREAEGHAEQGFLLKGIAVCKLVLEIDPGHTDAQERLAELCAARAREEGVPNRPARASSVEKTERTLPPGAPLEAISLARVVPAARAVAPHVTELSGGVSPYREDDGGEPITGPPALPRTPLFSALGERELRFLIENVRLLRKQPGELVFRQGERGEALYVVAHGEVSVLHEAPGRKAVVLARLSDGAFFGEIALLADHPRSATVRAEQATELIEITREVISDLIEVSPATLGVLVRFLRERLVETLLLTSPMFASFSESDKQALAARFRFLEVEPGLFLIQEGARAPGLFVIAAGRLEVSRRGVPVARLGPGDLCGEMSLLEGAPANAAVITASRCYLLALPRHECREIISTHPQVLEYAHAIAEKRRQANRRTSGEPS